MSTTAATETTIPTPGSRWRRVANLVLSHWDHLILMALLLFANRSLLAGEVRHDLIYLADPVAQGQWWRLLTYPLVHLSWYHLALDAGAFILLYRGLKVAAPSRRLLILVVCSTASLLIGIWFGEVRHLGLAGLSGIDHGLLAITALKMIQSSGQRNWGVAALLLVVGKSFYELLTGDVLFEALHGGLCGIPVGACHAGGVLGGFLAFWMLKDLETGTGNNTL